MLFSKRHHKRRRKLQQCLQCQCDRLERRWVFSNPILPTIPAGIFNITSYGANSSSSDNTTAIQATINAAAGAGGGTVEVPAGTFLSGPLTLASKINLQIDSSGELQMLAYGTYPLINGATSYANFINGSKLNNIEISGSGTIDGQGSPWWTAFNANQLTVTRPQMVSLSSCSFVEIQNITLTNPPNTHIGIGGASSNVTIQGITINTPSPSPNTDGIDLSGMNILVNNCVISDGDDNIAIGAGNVGTSYETGNVTITNCNFNNGHGCSIGSYTLGGVQNVLVNNCTFNGTVAGIRLKSERGRGGLVQNLTYSNITMTNVQYPINIHSYYNQGSVPSTPQDPPQAVTSTSYTPNWQNITISNVTSTNTATNSYCGIIWGVPEIPVENIVLSNVKISAHYGFDLDHVRNIHFDALCKITPATGAAFISTNSVATPYDAVYWIDQDINAPAVAGNTAYALAGTYNISGGGAGIGGTTDQFNFDSTVLTGDATLVANLTSQSSNSGSEAGVMIRATNASNSAFASVLLNPSGGISFVSRSGSVSNVAATGPASWVKLVRAGNNFTAYYGSNGATWTQIGSTTSVSMSGSVLAGIVATSGNNSVSTPLNPAIFSSVELLEVTASAFPTSTNINTSSTALTVYASDALNDGGLTYTWSATTIPTNAAAPTYSINGTNASNYTTVTFSSAGTYVLLATARSASGLVIASSTVNIVVNIPLTTITGTAGADTISLVRSGSLLDIYYNNSSSPAYAVTYSTQGALTIDGNGGADNVSLVFLAGDPIPAAGLNLINTGGTTEITVNGTSGADTAVVNAANMTFDGSMFSVSNASSISLNIGSSSSASITQAQAGAPALSLVGSNLNDALAINAGNFNVSAPVHGVGFGPYTLGSLNISSGAKVTLQTATASTDRTLLVLGSLSVGTTGLLDLGGNDMLIHHGSLPTLVQLPGITSAAVAGDTTHLTALGVIQNSVDGSTTGTALYGSFDGTAAVNTDVLIKYTYYGDANLDGKVDSSDYSRIDAGYLADQSVQNSATGWFSGDFNNDGVLNGSDYTLIDNAFNRQGAARPSAQVASRVLAAAIWPPGNGSFAQLDQRREKRTSVFDALTQELNANL